MRNTAQPVKLAFNVCAQAFWQLAFQAGGMDAKDTDIYQAGRGK